MSALAGIIVLRTRTEIGGVAAPQVPGTWTLAPQGQTGWIYTTSPSGLPLWWRTVLDGAELGAPTKIVGAVMALDAAGISFLKTFAVDNDRAWTLPELRADGGAQAVAIKAAWKERDGAAEILRSTIAGFDFRADAERYATIAELPDA